MQEGANQEVEQEPQEEQEVTEAQEVQKDKPVQKSADFNFRELRNVTQAQKEEIEYLRQQLDDLKKPKEEEPDEWEGYESDDYAKVEHVKKSSSEVKKLKKELQNVQQKLYQTEVERQESAARSRYDDYDYVIDNFGIPMIKKNPALGQALKAMPNWAEMAYEMAKATPEYKASQTQKTSKDAEKVIKNTKRPTSINAAPSSVKQQVDVFSNLSRAEIWKKSQEYANQA